jgi:hypothetical protein
LRQLGADQGNPEIGALLAPQVRRGLGDNDLKGRGYDAREEVAATNRTVLQPKNRVQVETRPTIVAPRNVAHQAQHLALLADIDRFVFPGGEVEPADLSRGEGADRRYRRTIQTLLVGKFGDRLESLFT